MSDDDINDEYTDVAGQELCPGDYFCYSASSGNAHSLSFGRILTRVPTDNRYGVGIRYFALNNWYGHGYDGKPETTDEVKKGHTRKLKNCLRVPPTSVPVLCRQALDEAYDKEKSPSPV